MCGPLAIASRTQSHHARLCVRWMLMRRRHVEEACGGGMWRGHVEEACGGGMRQHRDHACDG